MGKGCNRRPIEHLKEALNLKDTKNLFKVERIKSILESNRGVSIFNHFSYLTSDDVYELLALIIDGFGLKNLTNKQHGNYKPKLNRSPDHQQLLGACLIIQAFSQCVRDKVESFFKEDFKDGSLSDPRVYNCGYTGCTYTSSFKQARNDHEATDGERKFQCNIGSCKGAFYKKGHLNRHQELHNMKPKRNTTCIFCLKFFKSRFELLDHKRTHFGDKFKCPIHNTRYKNENVLCLNICLDPTGLR